MANPKKTIKINHDTHMAARIRIFISDMPAVKITGQIKQAPAKAMLWFLSWENRNLLSSLGF